MAKQKSIRARRKPPRLPRSLRKGPLPENPAAVWDAGLGALASAPGNGRGGFDALVAEGRRVEAAGGAAVREALRQLGAAAAALAGTTAGTTLGAVEEAVEAAVEAVLGVADASDRSDVDALRAELGRLERRLARMTGAAVAPASVTVVAAGGAWTVRVDGREVSVHPTKRGAVTAGRRVARENGPSRLVVHKMDGTGGETTEYGDAE